MDRGLAGPICIQCGTEIERPSECDMEMLRMGATMHRKCVDEYCAKVERSFREELTLVVLDEQARRAAISQYDRACAWHEANQQRGSEMEPPPFLVMLGADPQLIAYRAMVSEMED